MYVRHLCKFINAIKHNSLLINFIEQIDKQK
jgi:hypothetical protein